MPIISTPRGQVIINQTSLKAELKWNEGFGEKMSAKYMNAQQFVDSEVLRLCEPYIPLLTGMLIQSGVLGTEIGSGTVQWIAPYARRQYFSGRPAGSETGPLRGPAWFERMKAAHKEAIIAGARLKFGQGGS